MKLCKIEFEGIRAFSEKTVFHFGRTAGLYFLQGGDNAVDPELGSNGVGKSTIWGILCWVLFGKTPDGLRAADLKSWQTSSKGYYAKLWAGRSIIERSWQPNKLTLDGKVVEQKVLEDSIGIDFDTFVTAVVLAQGEQMFFDLAAPKKLSVFTSLLKLDNWIEYSEKAKEKAQDLQESINKHENSISRLNGRMDGLDTESLQEKSDTFRSMRMTAINILRTELEQVKPDLAKMKSRISKANKYKAELEADIDRLSKKIVVLRKNLKAISLMEKDNQKELLKILPKIAAVEEQIDYLEKHEGKKCVACSQHISSKVAARQYAKIAAKINRLEKEAKPFRSESKRLSRKIRYIEAKLFSYENELLKEVEKKYKDLNKNYSKLVDDYGVVKTSFKILQKKYDEDKHKKNPFKPLLLEKKKKEQSLHRKLRSKTQLKESVELRKENTEFWIQGFKDVRLYLIEEALLQLELETNKALMELGFTDGWSISYAIEKTSKRGSLVSGFNVFVRSPHSEKQVPFSAWSGGEKQRLKIAGSMGFISLVTDRTSMDLGIEVYDEPTQHLSPEGIDSLLESLHNRAMKTGKRIWLVDHHTLDYGDFSGHVVVNKDGRGRSSLCQG